MQLPVPLVSVSTAIQDILFREFGRLSLVVPNGIDCEKFYPDETTQNQKLQLISNGIHVRPLPIPFFIILTPVVISHLLEIYPPGGQSSTSSERL